MTLHEVLHETKRRNEVGVILKLDFQKKTPHSLMGISFGKS